MKSFERRIWLTAGVVVLCCLATLWVRTEYTLEVAPLAHDLAAVPLELDGWTGSDVPLDEDVVRILNAQESLNRVYRNRDGAVVEVHVSAWLRPESVKTVAPHIPKICYINSGWTIVGEREVRVKTDSGVLPMTTLLCERKGERIVVGYWYQMGNSYYTTSEEARRIHRRFWGQRQWPATVKVLLQTSAASIEAGLPQIEKFALTLQRELSETHDSPAQLKS